MAVNEWFVPRGRALSSFAQARPEAFRCSVALFLPYGLMVGLEFILIGSHQTNEHCFAD